MTNFQSIDATMTGAQQLVAELVEAGINTVFSLSGNQIMPIYDACLDFDVRIVHTRHEGSAVFMAEAWSQVTGQPGIALVTAAPGFANALGALYSTKMSQTPVLLLAGDSPQQLDGSGAFQEFAQTQAAAPFVKMTDRVMSAVDIRSKVRHALQMATGDMQGPVHLALPFDVLTADCANTSSDQTFQDTASSDESLGDIVDKFLQLTRQASRPIVLTGPQFSRSRRAPLIQTLGTQLDIPIHCIESPRGLKDPSLGSLAQVLKKADLVIYLGKEINFQTQFANDAVMPEAKLIIIHPFAEHIDSARIALGDRLSLAVRSNVNRFCDAVMSHRNSPTTDSINPDVSAEVSRSNWHTTVNAAVSNRELDQSTQKGIEQAHSNKHDSTLHAADIARAVNRSMATKRDTILICDGGEFGQWSQAFAQSEKRVINGASGAIGGSIAYAIAASIAAPEALVIAMLGDGTAGFYLAEFETAVREKTNPIFIIGNDSRWNAEHVIQQREYGPDRTYACELSKNTDYSDCAKALGIEGLTANSPETFEDVLQRAINISLSEHRAVCINALMHGTPAPGYKAKAIT